MDIFSALELLEDCDRANLAQAAIANDYRWPSKLTSNVMFYNGQRIMRREFEAYLVAYPLDLAASCTRIPNGGEDA